MIDRISIHGFLSLALIPDRDIIANFGSEVHTFFLSPKVGINLRSSPIVIPYFSLTVSQYGDNISFLTFIFPQQEDNHCVYNVIFLDI